LTNAGAFYRQPAVRHAPFWNNVARRQRCGGAAETASTRLTGRRIGARFALPVPCTAFFGYSSGAFS